MQKEYREEWLSSFEIDTLLTGLEYNNEVYKYMGIDIWSNFEDQEEGPLNITTIEDEIKTHPKIKVFGFVLN